MAVISVIIFSLLCSVLGILFRVFITLAINFDSRSRNLKSTTLFTVLTVFFPLITGIIYACVRNSAEKNKKECANCHLVVDGAATVCPSCSCPAFSEVIVPDKDKLSKRGVQFFITAAVCWALAFVFLIAIGVSGAYLGYDAVKGTDWSQVEDYIDDALDPDENDADDKDDNNSIFEGLTYYDMLGNSYDNPNDVLFYDREGNTYNCIQDTENFETYYVNTNTKEKLPNEKCFVDSEGYFVFDEKGEISLDDNLLTAKDKNGNKYCVASVVIWNEDGEMMGAMFND